MLLELIGIYAAYKVADRYNKLKERELDEEEELKDLEIQVRKLELKKRLQELNRMV